MNLRVDLPLGWARRVDVQRLQTLLSRCAYDDDVSLPPDPGGGGELCDIPVDDGIASQVIAVYGEAGVQTLVRRIIAASLVPDKPGTPQKARRTFQFEEGVRETFGIIAALVIPILILGVLIWLLGRGAKIAGGFTEWGGSATA